MKKDGKRETGDAGRERKCKAEVHSTIKRECLAIERNPDHEAFCRIRFAPGDGEGTMECLRGFRAGRIGDHCHRQNDRAVQGLRVRGDDE